ncbi:hypothetical protein [Corallococcus exercitus]|uniref:Uncharacterized protein n=1 Tax=Corallococcus exercitus TaxID=2316736 RepID=A0A7Y4KJI7_9BACT|nr:hypothetical protein [Corallococcus exercitus]NOK34470.1 hypothetical protein [Corallococcus exercitus]
MKASMRALLGASLAIAGCGHARREVTEAYDTDRIRAAVFQHVLAQPFSEASLGDGLVYCLDFESYKSAPFSGWNREGPRFVVPVDECKISAAGVTLAGRRPGAVAGTAAKITGSFLSVRDFDWATRDKVHATLNVYCGGLCGGWSDVELVRSGDGWEVTSLENRGRY